MWCLRTMSVGSNLVYHNLQILLEFRHFLRIGRSLYPDVVTPRNRAASAPGYPIFPTALQVEKGNPPDPYPS